MERSPGDARAAEQHSWVVEQASKRNIFCGGDVECSSHLLTIAQVRKRPTRAQIAVNECYKSMHTLLLFVNGAGREMADEVDRPTRAAKYPQAGLGLTSHPAGHTDRGSVPAGVQLLHLRLMVGWRSAFSVGAVAELQGEAADK